ncbi:AI-2E family transporter [Flocculibacter collagenilyticus]|uniref:AI-2E family transporter n=1 Tax=Flocculibacter collagenilyticus TaxID=2744479 RepID=UPI0018F66ABB|nr:AI-2E family transporter [Flocculibacter collagenilyticus]
MFREQSPVLRALLICACLIIILAGIKAASAIIVPFLLSVFIAIICNPLVSWLMRLKLPKSLAVFTVILLALTIGLSIAGLVGQSFNDFSLQMPTYKTKLSEELTWIVNKLAEFNIFINKEQLLSLFDPSIAMSMVAKMLSGLGGVMANLFLIILTVIFMLFEASSIPKKIHVALDDPTMKLQHIDRFLHSVNRYLAIKTVISLITGVIVTIMLWAFGVDYFLLWGVVAFLMNYIPNIGSIFAAVPAVLTALVVLGPAQAGFIGLGYILINTLMGNVIEPRYMGRGVGLSTLVVFLSLIFWGWLLGTVGMLLSVPLTMIVKIALEASDEGNWLATLLDSEEKHESNSAEAQEVDTTKDAKQEAIS